MVSNVQNIQLTNNVAIPLTAPKQEIKPNNNGLQQDTFEKSGLSKNQKRGLITVGLTAVLLIGSAIINKYNKAKRIKQIPEELRAIFKDLKGEEGKNFVNKAYDKLKQYMKLDGIAPDKIIHTGADKCETALQGGYQPTLNKIGYSDGFFDKIDKATQFSMLAHELKHAEQTTKIIRSGLLKEYARAWSEQTARATIHNPLNVDFNRAYNDAIKKGKGEEFLEKCIQDATDTVSSLMKETHKNTLKLPKYPKDSPEYAEAQKYIEATKNYTPLDEKGLGSEEYFNNPLEQEAYAFGDKMEKYYRDFFG